MNYLIKESKNWELFGYNLGQEPYTITEAKEIAEREGYPTNIQAGESIRITGIYDFLLVRK